jgi:PIN domain
VAIYIDTNVIPRSGRLDTLEFSILLAVARETGQDLTIPELVLDEAESHCLRTVEGTFEVLQRAYREARGYGGLPLLPELPVPGELAREYRRQLEALGSSAPAPDGAGEEALRREAYRLRPARGGKGARDTAIWLTVVAAHEAAGGPSYFLTKNTDDFSDSADPSRLHPDLRGELANDDLLLATSVEHLLELLSGAGDALLDLEFIQAQEACGSAVAKAVDQADLDAVLLEVVGEEDAGGKRKPYVAGSIVVKPLTVNESRGFQVEGRRVGVGWTRWSVAAPIGILKRVGSGMAVSTVEIEFHANFQLWVRMDDAGGVVAEASAISAIKAVQ